MEPLSLSISDLFLHVVKLGLDIYPLVEIADERTRLNMFYEETRQRWHKLADRVNASDTDFRISKEFRQTAEVPGPALPHETFVLAKRGPVFIFPLMLPPPIGHTNLEESYLDDFKQLLDLFLEVVPNRKVMRVGLVRDLIFQTGQSRCERYISDQGTFANADLAGGQLQFNYRDAKHNHNIRVQPVALMRTTRLPVGAAFNENTGYGMHVHFDVNNSDLQQPLGPGDIQQVLERATTLWPDVLLKYLRELFERRRS